ncbi:MAG: hypothetical protein H0U74_18485 [Bradymonadaceae bacterium]|nr:hypothetical protein [Lujinxingiaceae bacterium]
MIVILITVVGIKSSASLTGALETALFGAVALTFAVPIGIGLGGLIMGGDMRYLPTLLGSLLGAMLFVPLVIVGGPAAVPLIALGSIGGGVVGYNVAANISANQRESALQVGAITDSAGRWDGARVSLTLSF